MAKVSTTLQNIEYIKQEQQQRELTREETQKQYKLYTNYVNETIQEYLYYIFEDSKDIETTYNNIILSDDPLNKIIKDIDKEAQKHYKIIEEWKKDKDNEHYKEAQVKIYLWDDFINYNDIKQKYYKILEEIKKEYTKKENIKNDLLLEKVKNEIVLAFKSYPYNVVMSNYYSSSADHEIAQYYAHNTKEYLFIKNNYYNILNKISIQYKKIDNIQQKEQQRKQTQTKYKKNIIERNKGKIILFGVVSGFFKGLKNASK